MRRGKKLEERIEGWLSGKPSQDGKNAVRVDSQGVWGTKRTHRNRKKIKGK